MKSGIHPRYVPATVTCACGNSWQTMSTTAVLKTDLCSNCHPFYTGEQRIVDTAGQVERFMRRMNARSEQARETVVAKRGSKNKANVPPPPEARRPVTRTDEDGADTDAATAEPAEVATEA